MAVGTLVWPIQFSPLWQHKVLVGATLSIDCYFLALQAKQHLAAEREGHCNPTMAAPPTSLARGPVRPHLKHACSCNSYCLDGPTLVALTHAVPLCCGRA